MRFQNASSTSFFSPKRTSLPISDKYFCTATSVLSLSDKLWFPWRQWHQLWVRSDVIFSSELLYNWAESKDKVRSVSGTMIWVKDVRKRRNNRIKRIGSKLWSNVCISVGFNLPESQMGGVSEKRGDNASAKQRDNNRKPIENHLCSFAATTHKPSRCSVPASSSGRFTNWGIIW